MSHRSRGCIDPKAPGRSAITGSGQSGVWDFIPLRDRPRDGLFTAYPHLTLSLDADPDSAARHGQRQRSQRRRVFTPKMRSSSMCIGAILLTGYLGAATATQVRVEDPWFLFRVVIGVLAWGTLCLRGVVDLRPTRSTSN